MQQQLDMYLELEKQLLNLSRLEELAKCCEAEVPKVMANPGQQLYINQIETVSQALFFLQ